MIKFIICFPCLGLCGYILHEGLLYPIKIYKFLQFKTVAIASIMRKNIFIYLFSIFLLSCTAINASGLRNYFLGLIASHNIKIQEIKCKMFPATSRAGYFLFEINPQEFKKLKEGLRLQEKEASTYHEDIQIYELASEVKMLLLQGHPVASLFTNKRLNINETPENWPNPPVPNEVKLYYAVPPLPKNNPKFDYLIYNSSSNKCCVFMQYPYG